MSFAKPRPGGNAGYIGHILEVGHGSVLEHAVWNFVVTGVSRSFTHELVRHRAGFSFSQLSQRYVDESAAEFVEPRIIAEDPELHAIWCEAVEDAHKAYRVLVEKLMTRVGSASLKIGEADATAKRKIVRQAARSVLPNATETKIFVTANARALRHFFELRGSEHADPEIRDVAVMVWRTLVNVAPNLFGDYEESPLPDGSFKLTTPNRKV